MCREKKERMIREIYVGLGEVARGVRGREGARKGKGGSRNLGDVQGPYKAKEELRKATV